MKKVLKINNEEIEFFILKDQDGEFILELGGEKFSFNLLKNHPDHFVFRFNDHNHFASISPSRDAGLIVDGKSFQVGPIDIGRSSAKGGEGEMMSSPMPGRILKHLTRVGDKVEKGQGLLVMEAMKMEHTIKAAFDGFVEKIHFQEGELVDGGLELIDLKGLEEA